MQRQTAVVIGATGLIGSQLLELLLNDSNFSEVRVLSRKALSVSHSKLSVHIVAFDDYHLLKEKIITGHSLFCCVGTTQKKVKGDKAAYRKVDFEIPVNSAHAAFENGFRRYLFVSSVGADADSNNFYLKLKGEAEQAISKLAFESVHLFRPSLLLGNRTEFRLGEKIAQGSMQLLSFMFVGGLKKYKPIQSKYVARAMIAAAKNTSRGIQVHEYEQISKLAQ